MPTSKNDCEGTYIIKILQGREHNIKNDQETDLPHHQGLEIGKSAEEDSKIYNFGFKILILLRKRMISFGPILGLIGRNNIIEEFRQILE